MKLERLIREADTRIVNSSGSNYSDAVAVTAIANTSGFAGAYAWTRAGRSTGPVALDGGVKRIAHYGTAGRYLGELEPPTAVATTAVRRAVDLFGARKPQTMRVPVIFERDVAAAFLDDIFAAVSAANVAINNSWLTERVGSRVGSELVTIVDDGGLPGKLGSSPFDGEGVPTRRTPVFEGGVLRTFLYDTYYARKLGVASTGNSTGGGIGPNNFYLEPGTMSLRRTDRGNAARRSRARHDRLRDRACLGNVQPRRARILHRKRRAGVSDRRIYRRRAVHGDARTHRCHRQRPALGLGSRFAFVSRIGIDGQRK